MKPKINNAAGLKRFGVIILDSFLQVCEWKEPEELAALLDLELREEGEPKSRLLQRVQDVAKYSVKTSKGANRERGGGAHGNSHDGAFCVCVFQVIHVFLISSMQGWTITRWLADSSLRLSTRTCEKICVAQAD